MQRAEQERRKNEHLVFQKDPESILTETCHNSFCCKGLNSTWLKQKRDFIGPSEHVEIQVEVEIQVWMNPGELTERRASVKALRQVSLHLSALLSSPSFLLGPVSLSNSKMASFSWEPTCCQFSTSTEEKSLFPCSPWADSYWRDQGLVPPWAYPCFQRIEDAAWVGRLGLPAHPCSQRAASGLSKLHSFQNIHYGTL